MPRNYAKGDQVGLARHVESGVSERLTLAGSRYDLEQEPGGLRKVVGLIYDALCRSGIRYAPVPYNEFEQLQTIRTASEVFRQLEGNCLDLSLLFCGACLGYDLLPVMLMLDGHALAAVSVRHEKSDWNSPARSLGQALMDGPLTDVEALRGLIDGGEYVAVECTGFAQVGRMPGSMPEAKGRTAAGLLDFERAVAAGREQLDARPFHFALDIASAHFGMKIEPFPPEQTAAPPPPDPGGFKIGTGAKIKGKVGTMAVVVTDADVLPQMPPGNHEVLTDAEVGETGEIGEVSGVIQRSKSKPE